MEKEFIPYEQALALKELGFDEKCFRMWVGKNILRHEHIKNSQRSNSTYICSAPLYQQAFRWFREKTNYTIEFEVKRNANELVFLDNYYFIIYNSDRLDFDVSKETFDTFEITELECLKKLIKILKNENRS